MLLCACILAHNQLKRAETTEVSAWRNSKRNVQNLFVKLTKYLGMLILISMFFYSTLLAASSYNNKGCYFVHLPDNCC